MKKIFFVFFLIFAAMAFAFFRQIKLASPRLPADLSGKIDPDARIAIYEGKEIKVPQLVREITRPPVLGAASGSKWIEVDLSEQKIRAWDGNSLFLESLVSTGLPWWPTPKGEFTIWAKVRAAKMEGGEGKHYYYLPNVPYIMFFENASTPGWRGFSLHGTYWHNDFGRPRSHGCVNLPTPVAEKLYYWIGPQMPEGKRFVRASEDNPGTRVVIHD